MPKRKKTKFGASQPQGPAIKKRRLTPAMLDYKVPGKLVKKLSAFGRRRKEIVLALRRAGYDLRESSSGLHVGGRWGQRFPEARNGLFFGWDEVGMESHAGQNPKGRAQGKEKKKPWAGKRNLLNLMIPVRLVDKLCLAGKSKEQIIGVLRRAGYDLTVAPEGFILHGRYGYRMSISGQLFLWAELEGEHKKRLGST